MSAAAMKVRMRQDLQRSAAPLGSQATDRAVERRAAEPAVCRRRFAALDDTGAGGNRDSRQEALWAKCMAERPDIISEIATFIQEARLRIAEPSPLAPRAGAHSDDA